jgi:ribosomal-protein-alanine N-acetyltransferase
MTLGIRIRAGSRRDREAIAQIESCAFADPWNDIQIDSALDSPNTKCRVAEFGDDGPVGYCFYTRAADELEIQSLAVVPERRRKGVGAALVQDLLSDARKRGAVRVWLDVRAGNEAAIGLYRKAGFRQRGTREGYYDDGEDACVMALDV